MEGSSETGNSRPDLKIIPGGKTEPVEIPNIREYKPFHPSAQRQDTTGNVTPIRRKK